MTIRGPLAACLMVSGLAALHYVCVSVQILLADHFYVDNRTSYLMGASIAGLPWFDRTC